MTRDLSVDQVDQLLEDMVAHTLVDGDPRLATVGAWLRHHAELDRLEEQGRMVAA